MHDLTAEFSPRLLASPTLRDAATTAAGWLKERVGQSLDPLVAEWDVALDAAGNEVVTVTLRDFAGQVSAAFLPDEFENRAHAERRLGRLYQDLLGIRSHKLLSSLAASYRGNGE